MSEEEIERTKQRKLRARQKELEAEKAEETLKANLRMVLEENAYDRMTNISAVNKKLFLLAAQNLLMFYKKFGRKITDEETLALLRTIKEKTEVETKITFHKK
jgi:DNA-binding TFAR19-related protein (PDSD5 family)